MSRRLPAYWERWRRANTRRLVRDGLEVEVASKLSKVEAWARAGAARMYGIKAAASAALSLEFLPDGTMRGQLVGGEPATTAAKVKC